jgi:hypothetical protein
MVSAALQLQSINRSAPAITHYSGKYATVSFIRSGNTAICTTHAAYIPMAEFEKVLTITGELIRREKLSKFIFDKRSLSAFHQPSMEWYHLVWKKEMYQYGLRSHRKLLPDDKLFERHVLNGRKKIMTEHPDFDFDRYDIIYCQSMEEALSR